MYIELKPPKGPDTYSDAAKRMADTISLHTVSGNSGKFVAIKLHDGDSDGVLYDSWNEAVSHQLHEQMCLYIKVPPAGMTPQEADSLLRYARWAYDNGYRPSSFGEELISPVQMYDINKVAPRERYS